MPSSAAEQRRKWLIVVVMSMATLVVSVDNTILNVALPTITRTLGASAAQQQWIIDAYSLVFACLLLVAGALGDRFGRRLTLCVGLIWFGTSAIYSAAGSSPTDLIIGRALMGLGAAFIFPSTLSVLTTTFTDPKERGKAIGVWASISSISMVIGPISGGILVEHFGWHSVFLVNVPFCALTVIGALRYVPKGDKDTTRKFDPLGSALSIVAVGALLMAIIQGPEWGWTSFSVIASLGVAIAMFWFFFRWERSTPNPMLDVKIFRHPVFASAALAVTLTVFASFGSSFLTTVYFQFAQGFSALRSGLMIVPVAVAMISLGPHVSKIVNRFGTRNVMTCGLGILSGALVMHSVDAILSSLWWGALARFLLGIGMGLIMPPATMAVMSSLPSTHAGVGSAINDTTRQTGGALGVAIIGSLASSVYRHQFRLPPGIPVEAAAKARESIAGAIVAGSKLPGAAGRDLAQAGRLAFIQAAHYGYLASATVTLTTMVIVWRHVTNSGLIDHRRVAPEVAVPVDLVS